MGHYLWQWKIVNRFLKYFLHTAAVKTLKMDDAYQLVELSLQKRKQNSERCELVSAAESKQAVALCSAPRNFPFTSTFFLTSRALVVCQSIAWWLNFHHLKTLKGALISTNLWSSKHNEIKLAFHTKEKQSAFSLGEIFVNQVLSRSKNLTCSWLWKNRKKMDKAKQIRGHGNPFLRRLIACVDRTQ